MHSAQQTYTHARTEVSSLSFFISSHSESKAFLTHQFESEFDSSHVPGGMQQGSRRDERRIDLGERHSGRSLLSANLQTLSNHCFPLLGFLHIVNQGGNVDRPLDHGEQSV